MMIGEFSVAYASIVSHFSRKETIIHPKLLIYYAYVVM